MEIDPVDVVVRLIAEREYDSLGLRHAQAIARAEPEQWNDLLRVADVQGWSPEMAELAVSNLDDERLSTDHKANLLAGEIVPVVVSDSGTFEIPSEMVGRALREDRDPLLAVDALLETLEVLRSWLVREDIDAVVARCAPEDLRRLEDLIPGYIQYLTELFRAAYSRRHGA